MRKAAAFALAIASVGTAVYLLPGAPEPEATTKPLPTASAVPQPPRPAATVSPQTAAAPATTPTAPSTASRVFSPAQPLLQGAQPASPTTSAAFDPNARKLSSSRPADEDARNELVKDLQRELRRVGCYEGEITGAWTPAVRKAMASFTDRVNATLPLDEPDYILLTLIQGHSAQACGQSCPSGQTLGEAGKCLPRAVVAQAGKRAVEKTAIARDESKGSSVPPAAVRPQPAPIPPRVASSWSTVVTAPQAIEPQPPAPVRTQSPLPGRMAIGAQTVATAQPTPDEQTRSQIQRRKAELAAAAANQRDAESEAARKARLVEAEARKEREMLALKQKAAGERAQQLAAMAPPTVAPAPAPSVESEPAPTPRKAVTKKLPATLAKSDAAPTAKAGVEPPAPLTTPVRRQAPPRFVPPPYAVGRPVAPPRPYYASNSNYAPQPGRWMRTIFNDITRLR